MRKASQIALNALPIILMIGLIPYVKDELVLALVYLGVIGASLRVRYEVNDFLFLVFGFLVMAVAEAYFVSTGVETFTRRGLFGLMPLWLPVLWAYGFVAMRRMIRILES